MAGTPQERILAAELIVVMGVETADALSGAYTGKFSLPAPNRYFATLVAYLMLAAAALFGEKPAKLAAALGGVAALTILLSPSKVTGKPVALSALNYFDQMISGKSVGQINAAAGSGLTVNPGGTVSGAPAGTPAAAAGTANTDINTAITNLQKYIAANCTGSNSGSAACVSARATLASLQTQGFGSP
jgi:hypothetical protein